MKTESALTAAAAALESELARFDELATTLKRIPLDSGKNLDRAARATGEIAESQQRVGMQVGALVTAVAAARERQQVTADTLHARVQEIQERTNKFGELLKQFATLGEDARTINALMTDEGAAGAVVVRLQEAQARMGAVLDRADALRKDAESHDIQDIARQADALKQQLHAARNKLNLLRQRLATE